MSNGLLQHDELAATSAEPANTLSQSASDAARGVALLARMESVPHSAWHRRARITMGTATFFDAFDALSLAFILPTLIGAWALTPAETGVLIGSGYIGQLAGALGFGWFAERHGRVRSATFAVALMSVMGVICSLTGGFAALLVCRMIQGVGVGGEVPVAATYINELSRAKGRGRFFMFYELIFPLGLMLTGLIGAWLVPRFGWRTMFLLGAVPGLVVAVLISRLPESPRWLIHARKLREAERIVADIEASTPQRLAPAGMTDKTASPDAADTPLEHGGALRQLMSKTYRSRTLIVWLLWATSYFIANGLNNWVPTLYKTVYHLPLGDALKAASLNNVFQVVATIVCALVVDRMGRRWWTVAAFVVAALAFGYLGMTGATSAAWVIGLVVVGYGMTGTTNTLLYLYTPEIYPTRIRAVATSVATAWLRLSSAIAPALVGMFIGRGGIGFMFLTFAGVAVLGAIGAGYMIETRERRLEDIAP